MTQEQEKALSEIENESTIPEGYIEVKLSTKGKYGAPEVFHVRDLSVEDVMDMSISDVEDLPIKVCNKLQNIIYENVDVKQFFEQEVIETLLILYRKYYSKFMEFEYTPTKKDYDFIAEINGGKDSEGYKKIVEAIKTKEYNPKLKINLDNLETYKVDENNIKKEIRVTKKNSNFSVVFTAPRYGDVCVITEFIQKFYKEQDKRWETIAQIVKMREEAEEQLKNGEFDGNAFRKLPNIPKSELDAYNEYRNEKILFSMKCVRAARLAEVNGQDIRNLSLTDKIKYSEDARLDYIMFKKVEEYFSKLEIGVKPTIKAENPVTGGVENIDVNFRVYEILAAFRDSDSDEYEFEFE